MATTLLKENANVVYSKEAEFLPEEYNGLGYMNLFAMIFYINIQIDEFRKISKANQIPADINLLYIEEPEAHTHPQMQYIFIKNIQAKLQEGRKGKEDEDEINLQMILSSHSSHIVSQSDFEKIKFFYRENDVIYSKNLSDLKSEMIGTGDDGENRYRFLNRYHARSFEDAFISCNFEFIKQRKDKFKGLKNRSKFDNAKLSYYDIAEKCIDKKSAFATDILYFSDDNYSNWIIPEYIKEGLEWLAK